MTRFSSPPAPTRRKRKKGKTAAFVVLMIVGLLGMLYPLTATLVNNHNLSRILDETENRVEALPDTERDQKWQDMLDYNARLIEKPFSVTGIGGGESHEGYPEYLAVGSLGNPDVLSHIVIPEIDVSLPVYRGTSSDALRKGAGHLYGTTLPTGGEGSNTAISAHTGMVDASMFDALTELKEGDDIYLTTLGHKLRYQMVGSDVVRPDDTEAIPAPGVDGDNLYLITCTPYGLNTDRLIVHAKRVELEDPPPNLSDISNSMSGWQWWMTASIICALLVLLLALYPLLRTHFRKWRDRRKSAKSTKV